MNLNNNIKTQHRLRWSLKSDVNGLFVVLGVLLAMMLLPGPSEAEFQSRDLQMNDIVVVEDLK